MTIKKIGIVSQEGVNPAYVEGVYHVVKNLLYACNGYEKYLVCKLKKSPLISALINRGIYRAKKEGRFTERGFYQINAQPIIEGMLDYSAMHPDREYLLVMNDSIYANGLNYFLGANSKFRSRMGNLLNTTIISKGKGSPFEMEPLTFQAVLMHELGHRFGATDTHNRAPGELRDYEKLGRHCVTPGCIMNVANSLHDGKMAAQRNATFCSGCLSAMKRELSR